MPDLSAAIRVAALAQREDGKCESHQRRIGGRLLARYERSLQRVSSEIGKCGTFAELHDVLAGRRTERIGALAVYDTAVRIGGYLGLEPTDVYLHTGTGRGAAELGLRGSSGIVRVADLPRELRRLRPDELEDFLCIFKGKLRRFRRAGGQPG